MTDVHSIVDDHSHESDTSPFEKTKSLTISGFVKTKCKDGIFWVKYHTPDFFVQINDVQTEMTIYKDGVVTVFPLGET